MNRCSLCDTSRQRSNLCKYDGEKSLICSTQHTSTCVMRQLRRDPISERVRKRKAASYRTAFEQEITRRVLAAEGEA